MYNPIIFKIESLIGNVGWFFVFCEHFRAIIDDEKTRDGSSKFRSEGLQITGNRDSLIEPVMNRIGLMEISAIEAI